MSDLQIVDIDGAANGSDCYLCVNFSNGAHYEILLPDMPEDEWSLIVDVYEEVSQLRAQLTEYRNREMYLHTVRRTAEAGLRTTASPPFNSAWAGVFQHILDELALAGIKPPKEV